MKPHRSDLMPIILSVTGVGPEGDVFRIRIVADGARGYIAQFGLDGPDSTRMFSVPIAHEELTFGGNALDTLFAVLRSLDHGQRTAGYAWDRLANLAWGVTRHETGAGRNELGSG